MGIPILCLLEDNIEGFLLEKERRGETRNKMECKLNMKILRKHDWMKYVCVCVYIHIYLFIVVNGISSFSGYLMPNPSF